MITAETLRNGLRAWKDRARKEPRFPGDTPENPIWLSAEMFKAVAQFKAKTGRIKPYIAQYSSLPK